MRAQALHVAQFVTRCTGTSPASKRDVNNLAKYLLVSLFAGAVTAAYAQAPTEAPKKKAKAKSSKSSAARGATAPAPLPNPENDADFRKFDLDGDGLVSKAEAAGNYDLIVFFDRSDRSKDGKLSRLEYDRLTKAVAARKAKTRTAAAK
jgi:hypothetical protein